MFDEDFGKMKMEVFRERCRDVLGVSRAPLGQTKSAHGEDAGYEEDFGILEDVAYTSEVVDIVTAYKSLKLVMTKNVKGLAEGREQCTGKGYLKPTMASRQHARGNRPPPLGVGTANSLPPVPDAAHPLVNRGHTAPTLVGQRGHSRSTRAQTRGSYRTRGIDGQPLPPRPPHAN